MDDDEQYANWDAVTRLTIWVRDYGDNHPQTFVDDVRRTLALAIQKLKSPSISSIVEMPDWTFFK